ncbi:MAG: polysaccharide biosynthesis/export family protein, partial [Bacteroidaceae bacterium]|nr:polysaccharide biosynthesis/export family protein [Bacteroidaceae bacterium]
MKRFLLLIATVALLFSSCKTHEKILYLQDVTAGDIVPTQALTPLKYMPGDKMSVIVTSSATPQLAVQFNLPVVTMQAGSTNRSYSNQIAYYTVDEYGKINIPTLGSVKVQGLTRGEAAAKIQAELRNGHLRDAVVTVNSQDQYLTVLGEV